MKQEVRVRFAPAPTGFMHLGNVRTALINYLFARQHDGIFVLRIEDTDPQRLFDPGAKHILSDLSWLSIDYDEGPGVGGPYAPYFQSERTALYASYFKKLQENNMVYRCFCTVDELAKKRQRQIALKMPPRYDRHCFNKTNIEIEELLAQNVPFIWRFKMPHEHITVHDSARGDISFDLKNFSDFPITRTDGSFTFIFANTVDDMMMGITQVIRGEDHLSNTALQAVLYKTFGHEFPTFWHLPILCNKDGKKLSKRDFGFSLNDLRAAGFVPQALINYLAMLGTSHQREIMDMPMLIRDLDMTKLSSASQIKYDVDKLRWVNHAWLSAMPIKELTVAVRPFIERQFPQAKKVTDSVLESLVQVIQPELVTLANAPTLLAFYFEPPAVVHTDIDKFSDAVRTFVIRHLYALESTQDFKQWFTELKKDGKKAGMPMRDVCALIRLALTGMPSGIGIVDLVSMLPFAEIKKRMQSAGLHSDEGK